MILDDGGDATCSCTSAWSPRQAAGPRASEDDPDDGRSSWTYQATIAERPT